MKGSQLYLLRGTLKLQTPKPSKLTVLSRYLWYIIHFYNLQGPFIPYPGTAVKNQWSKEYYSNADCSLFCYHCFVTSLIDKKENLC